MRIFIRLLNLICFLICAQVVLQISTDVSIVIRAVNRGWTPPYSQFFFMLAVGVLVLDLAIASMLVAALYDWPFRRRAWVDFLAVLTSFSWLLLIVAGKQFSHPSLLVWPHWLLTGFGGVSGMGYLALTVIAASLFVETCSFYVETRKRRPVYTDGELSELAGSSEGAEPMDSS